MTIKTDSRTFVFCTVDMPKIEDRVENRLEEGESLERFDWDVCIRKIKPLIQEVANDVVDELRRYGLNSIKVNKVHLFKVDITLDVDKEKVIENFPEFQRIYESWGFTNYKLKTETNTHVIHCLNQAFQKHNGLFGGTGRWESVLEKAAVSPFRDDYCRILQYCVDGAEYLLYPERQAEADELYHAVFDKYGWAWRETEYQKGSELESMLYWAWKKGLTLDDLKSLV